MNKDKVKAMLLDNIMDIKLEVPKVVIGDFEKAPLKKILISERKMSIFREFLR